MGETNSHESTREGRVQGSLKYEVWNETELNVYETLPGVESISRIGAKKLKFILNEGYIPTPTFSIIG